MLFKIDENLSVEVAEALRQAGHDAVTLGEQRMSGEADPAVAAVCKREGRVLVTLDRDFANIRTYPPEGYPGLIVLRPGRQSIPRIMGAIAKVITLLGSRPIAGCLWIADEHAVRIREGGPSA